MNTQTYKPQVALMLDILPEISFENSFALHGGTAINLFIRNMPRLSVDIDLTYLPIEDRVQSFNHIIDMLQRIKRRIENKLSNIHVRHLENESKLTEEEKYFLIKLEEGSPNWGLYDFSRFPAVLWKLRNINKLKKENPNKHYYLCEILKGNLLKINK